MVSNGIQWYQMVSNGVVNRREKGLDHPAGWSEEDLINVSLQISEVEKKLFTSSINTSVQKPAVEKSVGGRSNDSPHPHPISQLICGYLIKDDVNVFPLRRFLLDITLQQLSSNYNW